MAAASMRARRSRRPSHLLRLRPMHPGEVAAVAVEEVAARRWAIKGSVFAGRQRVAAEAAAAMIRRQRPNRNRHCNCNPTGKTRFLLALYRLRRRRHRATAAFVERRVASTVLANGTSRISSRSGPTMEAAAALAARSDPSHRSSIVVIREMHRRASPTRTVPLRRHPRRHRCAIA